MIFCAIVLGTVAVTVYSACVMAEKEDEKLREYEADDRGDE